MRSGPRYRGQPPTWFVTGTDAAGVAAAVQAFNSQTLDGHFAVAVVNDAAIPLALALRERHAPAVRMPQRRASTPSRAAAKPAPHRRLRRLAEEPTSPPSAWALCPDALPCPVTRGRGGSHAADGSGRGATCFDRIHVSGRC